MPQTVAPQNLFESVWEDQFSCQDINLAKIKIRKVLLLGSDFL